MGIFDFGRKQRLHTQLIGDTSGKELFKVDEYNQRKRTNISLSVVLFLMATLFYFQIQNIPAKILVFLIIIFVGLCVWLYFNYKQQRRLREGLY